jgi:hypothetical protein
VAVTKNGIRCDIISNGRKMPPGKETLPAHLDSDRGWGHPVFARGQFMNSRSKAGRLAVRRSWTWVREMGTPGWFERPITADARQIQAACQAAMDQVKRDLEH